MLKLAPDIFDIKLLKSKKQFEVCTMSRDLGRVCKVGTAIDFKGGKKIKKKYSLFSEFEKLHDKN